MIDAIGASMAKAVKSDEQVIEMAFLITLSRHPTEGQARMGLDHLKTMPARPMAVANIFWALTNTKEFVKAP